MTATALKTRSPALFTAGRDDWRTPRKVYDDLHREFRFTLDPCPDLGLLKDGLERSWGGQRVFCNPPYGRGVGAWLAKAKEAVIAVYLLPSRTDTIWWHEYALKANEIRFIKGRLGFERDDGKRSRATFPSVVLIYRHHSTVE